MIDPARFPAAARLWAIGLCAFALACCATPRHATAAEPAAAAGNACKALLTTDFTRILDAPTQVTAAADTTPEDKTVPPYCRVTGTTAQTIGIELRLPLAGWNGDFYKHGCAGFCGVILGPACDMALRNGFACLLSDMGHASTMLQGGWGYQNMAAKIDFGFRATHLSTVAGKAITTAYYNRPPDKSFYEGCSTGGRQGMLLAQQFPEDFDGIVAGAPVIDETGASLQLMWSVRANLDANGRGILDRPQLELLHRAVLDQCDAADGLNDGVVNNPLSCRFDPARLLCTQGQTDSCLTQPQVDAARKIYAGPHDSKGRPLYTGGPVPGSELNWLNNYVGTGGALPLYGTFVGDFFRYLAFPADPGPSWQIADLDFDRDAARLRSMEKIYGASNPDLRRFDALGHKLLVYQGWADQSVVPLNIVDYFDLAGRTMGGADTLKSFARLFMVPGMGHCTGGPAADVTDYMQAVIDWVRKGQAPDRLLAAHLKVPAAIPVFHFPLDPATIAYTRPLYPYPIATAYDGHGDANDAASFGPVP